MKHRGFSVNSFNETDEAHWTQLIFSNRGLTLTARNYTVCILFNHVQIQNVHSALSDLNGTNLKSSIHPIRTKVVLRAGKGPDPGPPGPITPGSVPDWNKPLIWCRRWILSCRRTVENSPHCSLSSMWSLASGSHRKTTLCYWGKKKHLQFQFPWTLLGMSELTGSQFLYFWSAECQGD